MMENRAVVWWLRVVAAAVVGTLIVGGATRITDSGLSITEWAPLLGVIPPLTDAGWEAALEAYRQIPEYQLINRGMSIAEFQWIYWWEWAHRLLARTIGLIFFVPFVWFWVRGQLPGWFKPWGVALLLLGGLQGAVGWWMVSSGLVDRVDVSQYRLATHLLLACFILALTVWLSVRLAGRRGAQPVRRWVGWTAGLMAVAVFVQIGLGALVAGIDAGLASDTWPLMMGAFVPPGLDALAPAWLNSFENPLAVQFNHRMAGYAVLALALVHAALAWRAGEVRGPASAIALLTVAQMLIGIAVVVWRVPAPLAVLHQATAAVLLWLCVDHAARVRAAGAEARSAAAVPTA